jgi:putative addiction module component (TIGR02574 family)
MARAEEHLQALLMLPVEDRAHAAKLLLDSLDGEVDADAEEAWAAEIERRLAKIQAGEATLISAADAAARIQRAARGQ